MRLPKIFELLKSEQGITRGPYNGYLLWSIIALSVLSLLVFISENAVLFDAIQQILIFGSMALSYDYFSGYTGYYNLGFGAFVAFGAYLFVFASNTGLTIPVAILLAGIGSAIFALGISYPFLRLRGAYFAIATLALILLLRILDTNLRSITGGTAGIFLDYPVVPLRGEIFFGSLALALVALYFHFAIGKSRFGLALRGIKEEEEVTESFGINAFRMKQIALVLSGFFGGISGSFFALYLGFINVDNVLDLGVGLFPVVAAIAGGTGIFLGPLVGAFVLILVRLNLPSIINSIVFSFTTGPLVVTGLILLLVGIFAPGGLVRIRYFRNYNYKQMDEIIVKVFRKRKSAR